MDYSKFEEGPDSPLATCPFERRNVVSVVHSIVVSIFLRRARCDGLLFTTIQHDFA